MNITKNLKQQRLAWTCVSGGAGGNNVRSDGENVSGTVEIVRGVLPKIKKLELMYNPV